ncbi:MAG: hypothetical protein IT168_10305 [Bryobacterales bacterium]|nr:hypothetical protein [Bryobacterales bacterium]
MVIGYGMVAASQPDGAVLQYFPWALPTLVLAQWPVAMKTVCAIAALVAFGVTVAGCYEFQRRQAF